MRATPFGVNKETCRERVLLCSARAFLHSMRQTGISLTAGSFFLRAHYGPHEKSVMHSHPDSVAIFQTDGRVKFTFPNGKSEERDMKAGQALFTPAVRHLPENLSDNDMEVILVEFKTRRKPVAKKPADTTATTTPKKQ